MLFWTLVNASWMAEIEFSVQLKMLLSLPEGAVTWDKEAKRCLPLLYLEQVW